MTEILFILSLSIVAVFPAILVTAALKKRTVPAADEVSVQFAGQSVADEVNRHKLPPGTHPNSHWYRHTFEHPRKRR